MDAVTAVPAATPAANGMRRSPPCVLGSALAAVNRNLPPPEFAVAAVMTILLPWSTVGLVLAVNRKTSSLIGRSGRNTIRSRPWTVPWSAAIVKVNATRGRLGSGCARAAHDRAGADAVDDGAGLV